MSTAERDAAATPDLPVPAEQLGRVHFVGIGGAGMSGIARIMLARVPDYPSIVMAGRKR